MEPDLYSPAIHAKKKKEIKTNRKLKMTHDPITRWLT